jgi:flagellar operon protein
MIEAVGGARPRLAPELAASAGRPAVPFSDHLARRLSSAPLLFSAHARQRMEQRGIDLDPARLARLEEGVGRAARKGGRASLVLVDGTAFVVAVPNRTVITAVDREHMREHVFTNIDSAVLA